MDEQGWDIALMAQKYSPEELQELREKDRSALCKIMPTEQLIAPYIAKNTLLEMHPADAYCSLDDDCVILEQTNYEPVIHFIQDPLVGLVSTNWVRFNKPSFMAKKTIEDKYMQQKIVYTGGGMLFGQGVAKILINKPRTDWLFDNVQYSLDIYTAGYTNFRYLGSVTEHNIVIGGGKKRLLNDRQMIPNDSNLVVMKRGTVSKYKYDNEYYMPNDSNLTVLSHAMHKRNRLKLTGNE
jgi:hypothetical protein